MDCLVLLCPLGMVLIQPQAQPEATMAVVTAALPHALMDTVIDGTVVTEPGPAGSTTTRLLVGDALVVGVSTLLRLCFSACVCLRVARCLATPFSRYHAALSPFPPIMCLPTRVQGKLMTGRELHARLGHMIELVMKPLRQASTRGHPWHAFF